MSRHAGGWELKHVIASVAATIIMGGIVAVPAIVSYVGSPPAASTVTALTVVPDENNWG